METKKVKVFTLLHAVHKRAGISKQLNIHKITVYQDVQRMNNSELLKDCPRSGRSHIINC